MTTAKVMVTPGAKEKVAVIKTCHPSVCVGGAQPSSCVCPVTPKK